MGVEILILGVIVYLGVSLLLGERAYYWFLNYLGEKKLKELGLTLDDLEFSFEQIDYLVATPSVSCRVNSVESLYVKKVKRHIFGSRLHALRIISQVGEKEKVLAIIARDRFPVPLLDTLLYHDQINEREYELLASYLFAHQRTHRLIVEEVKTRITEGRSLEAEV